MQLIKITGIICLFTIGIFFENSFGQNISGVEEKEVRFESNGATLAGTLYMPKNVQNGPALVVVQQAGTETRENPLFVQIAETFTAIGYSVLVYDRRGHGLSEGSSERPRYSEMAEDAVAGKRAIAEFSAVHPDKIGFWGLSQSGWLAMEAAAMSNAGFVIAVSSPLTTPGEQMKVLVRNYVLKEGYGEEAANKALETRQLVMHDYFHDKISHENATKAIKEIEDEPWFKWAFLPASDKLPKNIQETSWIHEMDYDPIKAFEEVEVPLLYILGEQDIDIPVERTLEIIDGIESNKNREIVVVPEANHLMKGEQDDDEQLISTSARYFMVMGEWLGRQGLHNQVKNDRE